MAAKFHNLFPMYLVIFILGPNIASGQDTIPPNITIDDSLVETNYNLGGSGFDGSYLFIGEDTLEVTLSCIYLFPDDYYYKLENVIITDDSGSYIDTIVVDTIIYDDEGYGTIIQTIIAEDNSGNTSKFSIISRISDFKYQFSVLGMKVNGIDVGYDESTYSLEQTDFEICEAQNIDVVMLYSKNGCTGDTKVDWYIENELASTDSEEITFQLYSTDSIELSAEAKYSNTNLEDRIRIKFRRIINDSSTDIINPICSNSAYGSIKLDAAVSNVKWEQSGLNAKSLDSLSAGSYYVTYTYNGCEFNDSITLIPQNVLDFTISDTLIDLNQNESLTINNTSNITGNYLWQIKDSSFINNQNEFEFSFNSAGDYEIKLISSSEICSDTIYKNVTVEGDLPVQDTIPPQITIDESQINANYRPDDPDLYYEFLSDDTLKIFISCLYYFPEEYYFELENVTIEDESGVVHDTIIIETIPDERGYGTVYHTIIAEDNSGNKSELVVIAAIDAIYNFDYRGMNVGDIQVLYDESNYTLEKSEFEFCSHTNIEVEALYSKNGCTGFTLIDWYINDELVSRNSDTISIVLGNETDSIELAVEAKFSNTDFNDRIPITIKKTSNDSFIVLDNPTCSNYADGSIYLDSRVSNVEWFHNNSNALNLSSLEEGLYYVSYSYNNCEFNDTIILIPDNILDFTVSDKIIDLNQNELLTITNISNLTGDFSWQIGDSTFVNNEDEFIFAFKSPGNYEIKLTNNNGVCTSAISKTISVEENIVVEDTTVPKILIDGPQINTNYFLDEELGFDGVYSFLGQNKDTLEVTLSCKYVFPDDYYFRLENAVIEDESGIYRDTIIVEDIIYDDEGYGTLVQEVVAEDNYGNTSKLKIITHVSESKHSFDVLGANVGGIEVAYDENTFALENTDFEFCEGDNVEILMLYSKNRCTGTTKINWYIDDELVSTNSDKIYLDLSNENETISLASEANYSNTNLQDRIRFNIHNKINDAQLNINQPKCSNSSDGKINLDPLVSNVKWLHDNSNELSLNSLSPGIYYVSYVYNGCNFTDSIKLAPEFPLDFTLSDTVIDLTQNELLTVYNFSGNSGIFFWQIGDSAFINNENEFEFAFKSPGDYEIKLMRNDGLCIDTISKNIVVEGTTNINKNLFSSFRISPNPFNNFLNIEFDAPSKYHIAVFGVDGRVYFKDQVSHMKNYQVNTGFLSPGIYFLYITSEENLSNINGYKIIKLKE